MKVSGNSNNTFNTIDAKNRSEKSSSSKLNDALKANATKNADNGAMVSVSVRAKEAQKIYDAAMAAPDVDEAKVAKFQKLIDAGEYKVDSDAVAEKMLAEHLVST